MSAFEKAQALRPNLNVRFATVPYPRLTKQKRTFESGHSFRASLVQRNLFHFIFPHGMTADARHIQFLQGLAGLEPIFLGSSFRCSFRVLVQQFVE